MTMFEAIRNLSTGTIALPESVKFAYPELTITALQVTNSGNMLFSVTNGDQIRGFQVTPEILKLKRIFNLDPEAEAIAILMGSFDAQITKSVMGITWEKTAE